MPAKAVVRIAGIDLIDMVMSLPLQKLVEGLEISSPAAMVGYVGSSTYAARFAYETTDV